jgi:hypothetical protein
VNHKLALFLVASLVAERALRGSTPPDRQYYPEIGERDWTEVTSLVRRMAESCEPPRLSAERAYAFLATKAADR